MKYICIFFLALSFFCTSALAAVTSKEVLQYVASFDGRIGVYAENLKTGKYFRFRETDVFATASTSKLVVALAVYKYLYPTATDDAREMYDTDIYWMMHISDNDSFYELLNKIDSTSPNLLKKTTFDLGLKKTMIHDDFAFKQFGYHSVTTPREMAEVFKDIDRGKYLDKDTSNKLKDELANTIFHDEIPRFMETTVLHKVGELDNVLCDVGIVDDGKNRILISIYTDSTRPEEYKSDMIAYTAAKLYNLLRK